MKAKLLLCCNLAIIFLLFQLGNWTTPTPGTSSGNGNPVILLFLPLFILLIWLIIQWFYMFKQKSINLKAGIIACFILACHWGAGIYYQIVSLHNYRNLLARVYEDKFGYTDWDYIEDITSGLSIHINNQLFNWNTYLLLINFSLLFWLISYMATQFIRKHFDYIAGGR